MAEEPAAAPKKKRKKPCARCGDFAKTAKLGERRLCLACLDRCDAIEREPLLITDLLRASAVLAWRTSKSWFPIGLAIAIAQAAVAIAGSNTPGGSIAELILGTVGLLLMSSVRADASAAVLAGGPPPSPTVLVGRMGPRWTPLFTSWVVTQFDVGLRSLLFVVPGIVRYCDLVLGMPIVVLEGRGGLDALRESTERMRGSRLTLALTNVVAFTPILAFLLLARPITFGEEAPRPVQLGVLYLALMLLPFIPTALYFKLRWQAARAKLAPA
jgi:hypothetical protein